MTKGPVRIGVVGCGYWGPNLIRNFRSTENAELTFMCDLDPKRLRHLGKLYPGVKTTSSFDDQIRDDTFDAIAIATPVHLHHALARKSLLAGKHTFIEKPMAASTAECEELVEIAARNGLTLMVGHTFLYCPTVRRIKEIVDQGGIGDIRYISARRLNLGLFQRDINVVWDLAPHDISIIAYIMGSTPTALNCQGSANVAPDVEDVSNLALFFGDRGFATIHSSWLDPKKVRDMTIVGTKKMIHYDDLEPLQKIKIYDQRVETPPHYDTFAEFHYSYHYGDMHAPYVRQEEPLKIECQHFIDCIRTGDRPMTDGRHGLEMIRILEAASTSLRSQGSRVNIAT